MKFNNYIREVNKHSYFTCMALESAITFAMRKAGVAALKEKQRDCIFRFVECNDVFASLPTGYGKSLIYGLLPDHFLPVGSPKAAALCNFFTTYSLFALIS